MKKISILVFFLLKMIIFGQEKLTIEYEMQTNNNTANINFGDIVLPDNLKQEFTKKLREQKPSISKFILYYNDGNSYFHNIISFDKKQFLEEQNIETFKLKNKKGWYSLSDYIVDKFYGHYTTLPKYDYKDDYKIIENYKCKLVIVKDNNVESKVWYTDEIPISTGPFNYLFQPGLVLMVERPNQMIYATKIIKNCGLEKIKKMDLKLPIYSENDIISKIAEGDKKMTEYFKNKTSKIDNIFKNK